MDTVENKIKILFYRDVSRRLAEAGTKFLRVSSSRSPLGEGEGVTEQFGAV